MPVITFATVPGLSTYRIYRSNDGPPTNSSTLIAQVEAAPGATSIQFVDAPIPQPGVTYFGPPIHEVEGRLLGQWPRDLGHDTWEWEFGFSSFSRYRYGVQAVAGQTCSSIVEVEARSGTETATADVYWKPQDRWEKIATDQRSPAHFCLPPLRFPAPQQVRLERWVTPPIGWLQFACESTLAREISLRLVVGPQTLDATVYQTLILTGFVVRRGWYTIPSVSGPDGETLQVLNADERQVTFPLLAQPQILALYPLAPDPGEPLVVVVEETADTLSPPKRVVALRLW